MDAFAGEDELATGVDFDWSLVNKSGNEMDGAGLIGPDVEKDTVCRFAGDDGAGDCGSAEAVGGGDGVFSRGGAFELRRLIVIADPLDTECGTGLAVFFPNSQVGERGGVFDLATEARGGDRSGGEEGCC